MLPGGDVNDAFHVVPRAKALRMEENFALNARMRRFPWSINAFAASLCIPTLTVFPPIRTVTFRPWFGLLKKIPYLL